jgi:hypothetical protein
MPAAKKKPAPSLEPAAPPVNSVAIATPTAENPDDIKAMGALTYAETFSIASASDSAKGQEASQRLNMQIEALDNKRKELTRPLDALKKKWMEFFGGPIEKFKKAKGIIDAKVITWQSEQEELRRAEQRRLDKIAEDERRRLQAIADETARKAREEVDKKRREAEAAAAAGRAEEAAKLRAQAARVEERAADKVDAYEDRASAVVAHVAIADTAQVAGTSFRETPQFEILDATKINAAFMAPDEVKIGRVVRSLGLEAVGVVGPGLKVTMKKGLASRRT